MVKAAPKLRDQVWRAFYINGPMTCEQAEGVTGLSHQTCSARVRELMLAGRLVDTEIRQPTKSGRNARVLRAVDPAR